MSAVYIDGRVHLVEELTSEQVFYLIQCGRISKEQLEEWRQSTFDAGVKQGESTDPDWRK